MNQLISNALGIRQEQGDLVIDPVLPTELDGLHFDFQYAGMKITFIYHITGGPVNAVALNGNQIDTERLTNPYRQGGIRLSQSVFEQAMNPEDHVIDIFM
jgi:cellobiose phosphorylase